MKNKFSAGVIMGIMCSLLIFCGIFAIYITRNTPQENNQVQENTGNNSSVQSSSKISDFDRKVNYLKKLIDTSFLWEASEEKYPDAMYKGLLEALEDPYSCYYTKEEFDSFMQSTTGVYFGIGATVSQNVKTGVITIVKPFVDGPAYKAGILPGDILYMVEEEEVTGIDVTTVTTRMKGDKGTKVKLSVIREGEQNPIEFTVIRDKIEVPTVEWKMLEDKIGYIYIMEFDEVTVEQYLKAIDELESQGMKGLVIDIRNNPGGQLDSVVAMLERMLPKGLIVYTEDKAGKRSEISGKGLNEFKLPLVVMINENSASASEIFAGAIQDYEKGTILGMQSFGKGIVQTVYPLYDGSAVKLTVSNYFTPKGRNIHKKGITPDIEVQLDENIAKKLIITLEEDNQLQKAIEVLEGKIQ